MFSVTFFSFLVSAPMPFGVARINAALPQSNTYNFLKVESD